MQRARKDAEGVGVPAWVIQLVLTGEVKKVTF